jgi:diaminopimelate decarboxylase
VNESVLKPDACGAAFVQRLADTHGTPFYAYDTAVFAARIDALRAALPAGSRLLYSAKANPHEQLLTAADAAGCGLELASSGELQRSIAAGLDPAGALLVGPAKSDAFLATALAAGIGAIVVESVNELRRLEGIAKRMAVENITVLLRLSLNGAKGSLRMSGHQFGMERDDIVACHAAMAGSKLLRFAGYHGYLASQLLDAAEVIHNAGLVLDAVDALTREVGIKPDNLDLGGGFGIRYTPIGSQLDLSAVAEGLTRVVRRSSVTTSKLLFESGRYLAGPAGALVCRVIDTKTIGGRRFILLDAGMNTSGIFGGSMAVRNLAHNVIRGGVLVDGGTSANICGPLCTPMDRLATSVPCPARVDDLVVWWNMGAYGFTAAPIGFLSFPAPAEVVV